jgi:hypothetical protein
MGQPIPVQSPGDVGIPLAPDHGIDFQGIEPHCCQGFPDAPGHEGVDDQGRPIGLGKPPNGELPGIDGIPGTVDIPGIEGMPGIVDMPGMVVIPGHAGMPGIVDIPGIGGIPVVPPGIIEDHPPA